MNNRIINFLRLAFVSWLLFQLFSYNAEAGNSASCSGSSGGINGSMTLQINFTSYSNGVWNCAAVYNFSGTAYAEGQAQWGSSNSGTQSASNPSGVTTFTTGPGSFTISCTVGNGSVSGMGTSGPVTCTTPTIPPQPKAQTVNGVNTAPVDGVMVWYDATTGEYVTSSATAVASGAAYSMTAISNGDNMQLVFITQSLAQFNSNSMYGDASWTISGNILGGGSGVLAVVMQDIPYAGMTNTNGTGVPDTSGNGTVQQTQTPTLKTSVSGMTSGTVITDAGNSGSAGSGSGASGPNMGAVFGAGTNPNQTLNTSGLTNGQFNQGVNAIVQQQGNGIIATNKGSQEIASAISGLGTAISGSNAVYVQNWPGTQMVSGTVTVANMISGVTVSFPSSIAISNFPSSTPVVFPSSIAISNLSSSFGGGSATISGVVSTYDSGLAVLVSSGNGTLIAIQGTLSGILVGQGKANAFYDAVSAAQALTPSTGYMLAQGTIAGNADAAAVGTGFDVVPDTNPAVTTATQDTDFSITLPPKMGSGSGTKKIVFNWIDELLPLLSGFRVALAWLVLAKFGYSCFKSVQFVELGIGTAHQSYGNAIVGGTGAQSTAVVAATLITVAVSAAVVGLMGLIFGDFGLGGSIPGLFTGSHAGQPFWAMPLKVVWMLDQVFPIATVVASLLGRIAFAALSMKIFLVAIGIIRYIVP